MKYCSNCGAELHGKFCSECGHKAETDGPSFKDRVSAVWGKVKSWAVTAWNFIKAHKIPALIISGGLVALIVIIIIIASLSNIYRAGKVSEITLGMSEEEVKSILGEPTETFYSALIWFEDSVAKKAEEADKLLEDAFMSDGGDVDGAIEQYDRIQAELEKMTYGLILVNFDNDKRVTEVFFDASHHYESLPFKAPPYGDGDKKAKTITLDAKIGTVQTVDKDGKVLSIDVPQSYRNVPYSIEYEDGSYYRYRTYASEGNLTLSDDGKLATLKWDNKISEDTYEKVVSLEVCAKIRDDGKLISWQLEEETITLPAEVKLIEKSAFSENEKIKKILFSSTDCTISADSFDNCKALEFNSYEGGLYLGAEYNPYAYLVKLDKGYDGAFSLNDDCNNASPGIFANHSEVVYTLIDENTAKILHFPSGHKGAVSLPDTVIKVVIAEEIYTIPTEAFSGNKKITGITIPNSIAKIGDRAFLDCSSLASIIVPNSVTSIGNSAFSGCSSLTSVTIPNSVTNIGLEAFQGCSSLTSIIVPNSITSIGGFVFSGCSSLASVTIPDSVTSIGGFVFSGCTSLTSVTIPDSVTSIGYSAFSGCSSLTDVYYTGTEEEWSNIGGLDTSYLTGATIHYNFVIPEE